MTKIRTDHLNALEHADYAPFPAPVYLRGSVRTCATVLKMDVPSVLSALDAELAESPEFSDPPSLSGGRRGPLDWLMYQLSRVNWRLTGGAGVVLVVGVATFWAWSAWNHRLREDPLSDLGPGIYQGGTNAAGEGDVLRLPGNAVPERSP